MLTLYKILMNLAYIASWPYWFVKQLSAGQEWRQRRGYYRDVLPAGGLQDVIWFHASSMGEVRVLERLIQAFEKRNPGVPFIVSTYTNTGYELARKLFPHAKAVVYFPLDCLWVLRRVFRVVRPRGVVIVETEIWVYFLTFCKKYEIPVVLANGRLSEKSTRSYQKFAHALSRVFSVYRAFLVQCVADAKRYEEIGAPNDAIQVLGNLKHDIDSDDDREARRESVRNEFGLSILQKFFIAASTRPGEEEIICKCLRLLDESLAFHKVLIAPRHLERLPEVEEILKSSGFSYCLYSEFAQRTKSAPVILMDRMGLLKELFYGADIAFVGGTMGDIGGHNIMEPVLAGVPVLFGPSVFNVEDAAEKITANNWGKQVASTDELATVLRGFASGSLHFNQIKQQGESAADKTVDVIMQEFGL
ncbi:MAG: glycosyltransferase N-terminal domain-containing protein [Candidatus Zixiibacteriota bacterium]